MSELTDRLRGLKQDPRRPNDWPYTLQDGLNEALDEIAMLTAERDELREQLVLNCGYIGGLQVNARKLRKEISQLTAERDRLKRSHEFFLEKRCDLSTLLRLECYSMTLVEDAVKRIQAERDTLRKTVDKYPKAADGVTIVPGMRLWTSYNNGRVVAGFTTHDGRLTCIDFVDGFDKCVWAQYSTEAAAKAASKETK